MATIQVADHRLWDTHDPYLYTLIISLDPDDAGMEDEVSLRFGFREVSTRDGKILLNGEPIYLLSALDQDMYADTIYTVPSEEFLRDEFHKAKELGLNCLRCHIKPPDPLYLDLADEMGLLVWTEIPSWRTFYLRGSIHKNQLDLGSTIQHRAEQTLREMIRRDYNHPSIIIWTIVNEDWGTSLPLSASDRRWVSGMYDLCKQLDPTRLVVDNSPCPHEWGPNIHVHSDLDDFHFYANIPTRRPPGKPLLNSSACGLCGPSPATAIPSAQAKSRWCCRSSATGDCLPCRRSAKRQGVKIPHGLHWVPGGAVGRANRVGHAA